MSTPTGPAPLNEESVLRELDLKCDAVMLAEDKLRARQQSRDITIGSARAAGVSVVDLAARTDLSVPRIYQILAEQD